MSMLKAFNNNLEYLEDCLEILRLRILRLKLRRSLSGLDDEGDSLGDLDESTNFKILRRRLQNAFTGFGSEDYQEEGSDEEDGGESIEDSLRSKRRRLAKTNRTLKRRTENHKKRILITRESGVEIALETVVERHNLDDFEKMTILLALGPSLDPSFGNALSKVSRGGRTPEVRDILEILCDSLIEKVVARRKFTYDAPLVANNLIELSRSRSSKLSESDFMQMDIEITQRLANQILGEYGIDSEMVSFSRIIQPEVELEQVVLPGEMRANVLKLVNRRQEMLIKREEWGFNRIMPYGKATVMLFSGPSGTGKTMLAHAVAKKVGQNLMLVDFGKLVETGDFEEGLQLVFLEARLRNAILFFDEADEIFTDRCANSCMPTILREFEKLDGIAILATNRGCIIDEAMERRILCKFEFEIPIPSLRERIWRNHLPPEAPIDPDVDFAQLAEEFDFSGGFIKNAVLVALQNALQRDGEQRITHADLIFGARQQRMNRFDVSVDKRIPRVGLNDVVLADSVRKQVEKLVQAARRRGTVFSAWGLGKKLSVGKSISAVFLGSSGIGKTMTAEAVAYELGQVLYPVNLTTVISKYVGETGKNLSRVFAAAREVEAVLFFDEADALFGSRIDGDDHHALYINQQINTLLMEIEKYEGVVILATNRPDSLDNAFERRLSYRIRFEKPSVKAREVIWRGFITDSTPIAPDVDFKILAENFDFTGGAIKNVLLRAAFDAATNGGVITMRHLLESANEEQPLMETRRIGFASTGSKLV